LATMSPKTPVTDALLASAAGAGDPRAQLADVLRAALELVALPGNDFCWSYWEDAAHAARDIEPLLATLAAGGLPDQHPVAMLFVPTGALQEVGVGSGWGDVFCALGERYDALVPRLWGGS
jgi:hypothetical protein